MRATLRDKWDLLRDEAALEWPGIPANEFHWVEGKLERLVALVQGHYGLTRREANNRVREFVERVRL